MNDRPLYDEPLCKKCLHPLDSHDTRTIKRNTNHFKNKHRTIQIRMCTINVCKCIDIIETS
jgi:hypothetical protein